jgi:spore coat polysaccharide biosynthesis protein SpsF
LQFNPGIIPECSNSEQKNSQTILVVQARLNSARLPGKVMRKLAGKTMLERTLERLSDCKRASKIVVATSVEETDDPIAEYCEQTQWPCYRGNLENVAERFAAIIQQKQTPAFVRISGDSPLIDPKIVDQAIQLYGNSDSDLVSNILIRSFPKGQSVEVLKSDTFLGILPEFDKYEQEHVTPFYYRHPQRFRITAFTSGVDAGSCQLSIDTPADFEKVEWLLKKTSGNPGSWKELWQLSQQLEN